MQRRGSSKSLKLRHIARQRVCLQSLLRVSIIYSVMLRSCSGAVQQSPKHWRHVPTKRGKGSDCRRYEGSITRWNFFQKTVIHALVPQGARLNHSPYSTECCKTDFPVKNGGCVLHSFALFANEREQGKAETQRAAGQRPSSPSPSPAASAHSRGSPGSA